MLALYRSGRQADALEAYRTRDPRSWTRSGVEPGPELRHLHEQILGQDPALDLPARERAARRAAPPPARERRRPRPLLIAVRGVLIAVGVALGITRLTGPDTLGHVTEDAVGVIDPGNGHIVARSTASGTRPTRSRRAAARCGSPTGATAPSPASTAVASRSRRSTSAASPRRSCRRRDRSGSPTARTAVLTRSTRARTVSSAAAGGQRAARRGRGGRSHLGGIGGRRAGGPHRPRARRRGTGAIDARGGPAAIAAGAGAVWVAERGGRRRDAAGAPLGRGARRRSGSATARRRSPWARARSGSPTARTGRSRGSMPRPTRSATPCASAAARSRSPAGWARSGWPTGSGRRDPHRPADAPRQAAHRARQRAVRRSPSPAARVWTAAIASRASHRGGTLRFASRADRRLQLHGPRGLRRRELAGLSLGLRRPGRLPPHPGRRRQHARRRSRRERPASRADGGRTYTFQLRPGLRFSDGAPVRPEDFRATIERVVRLAARDVAAVLAASPAPRHAARGAATSRGASRPTPRADDHDPPPAAGCRVRAQARAAAGLRAARPTRRRADPRRGRRRGRARTGSPRSRPSEACDWCATRAFARGRPRRAPTGSPTRSTSRSPSDPASAGGRRAARPRGCGRRRRRVRRPGVARPGPRARARRGQPRAHAAPRQHRLRSSSTSVSAPFDDVRVRRALNYAIDRRRVVELARRRRLAGLTCQMLPPGLPGYEPTCPSRVDATPRRWLVGARSRAGAPADRGVGHARSACAACGRLPKYAGAAIRYAGERPAPPGLPGPGAGAARRRALLRRTSPTRDTRSRSGSPAGSPTS